MSIEELNCYFSNELLRLIRVTNVKLAAVVALVGNDQVAGPEARLLGPCLGATPAGIRDLSVASSDRRISPDTIDRHREPSMPPIVPELSNRCISFIIDIT